MNPAFYDCLMSMREGEIATFKIPKGLNDQNKVNENIPDNISLIYEIELMEILNDI